jgi:hypothetical protein
MRRHHALVVVLLAAVAGCGGEAERARPAAEPEADRRAIAEHVSGYLRAYATGDGARACAGLTPALRGRSASGLSCAELLRRVGPKLLTAVGPGEREALLDRVSDPANIVVTVTGDVATAGVEPLRPGRSTSRVRLSRQGGRWLISELGLPAR